MKCRFKVNEFEVDGQSFEGTHSIIRLLDDEPVFIDKNLLETIVECRGPILDCCARMREYVAESGKHEGFEFSDNKWNINGCCHGGCFVVNDIRFCPFCGTELVLKK